MTDAEMQDIREQNDLAREYVKDPSCPGTFLAPLVVHIDSLLAEVERLRAASLECVDTCEEDWAEQVAGVIRAMLNPPPPSARPPESLPPRR